MSIETVHCPVDKAPTFILYHDIIDFSEHIRHHNLLHTCLRVMDETEARRERIQRRCIAFDTTVSDCVVACF